MKTLKDKIKEILVKSAKENISLDKAISRILSAMKEDYVIPKSAVLLKGKKKYTAKEMMEKFEAEQQVLDEIREWQRPHYPKGYKNRYSYLRDKIKSWQKRLKK